MTLHNCRLQPALCERLLDILARSLWILHLQLTFTMPHIIYKKSFPITHTLLVINAEYKNISISCMCDTCGWICFCVMCMCIHTWGDQKLMSGMFFDLFLPDVLRQGLLVNLWLTDWLECLTRKFQVSSCLCLPNSGSIDMHFFNCFHPPRFSHG